MKLFTCTFCLEEKPSRSKAVNVAGDDICRDCFESDIRPKFFEAIKNENAWPVKWGGTTLEVKDFPGFSAAFKSRWRAKEQEYRTPMAERVYCKQHIDDNGLAEHAPIRIANDEAGLEGVRPERCDRFLGSTTEVNDRTVFCEACEGRTCGACLGPVSRWAHSCVTAEAVSEPDPFQGLVRGKDFQRCPSCRLLVTLEDGCNSMVCERPSCQTHFCWICGVEAHHDSDHWRVGARCPRWNQPNAANARHDQAVQDPQLAALMAELEEERDIFRALQIALKTDLFRAQVEDAATEMGRHFHLDEVVLADIIMKLQEDGRDAKTRNVVFRPEQRRLLHAINRLFVNIQLYGWPVDELEPVGSDTLLEALGVWRRMHAELVHAAAAVSPEMLTNYPGFQEIYERYLHFYPERMEEHATRAFFL